MCFHLYYFYNFSNHNAFYNLLLGYKALCTLDKRDRNRLLKDNTSLEAVTLLKKVIMKYSYCLTMNTYVTGSLKRVQLLGIKNLNVLCLGSKPLGFEQQ